MRNVLATALIVAVMGVACGAEQPDGSEAGDLFSDAYTENQSPKADGASCSGVVVPDQSGFDKRVALTFDDGPLAATTPQVIEILRRHDLPATFFINGVRVKNAATRALVKEVVDDPNFLLANHTWSHENMKNLSESEAADQIDRVTPLIEEAGGDPVWFRFPFGSSSCRTMKQIQDRGYTSVGWHIDTADWCFAPGHGHCAKETFEHVPDDMRDSYFDWTMSQVRQKNGGIILMHDIHQFTVDHLEQIIEALLEEGYTFTRLDDADAFPLLNGVELEFIGDPCETDDECAFEGGFCVPDGEVPGGYCSKGCSASCPDRSGYPTTRCVEAPDGSGATTELCAISCGDGCRDGLECQSLSGRDVCWR